MFYQGNFCWWILHVIVPKQFCGVVVSRQNVTLLQNTCCPVPYYEWVLQQFVSPLVYHVRYIRLRFKELLQSTAIWKYRELWFPQVIFKISYGPTYYGCLSYKAMSWLRQYRHFWSWYWEKLVVDAFLLSTCQIHIFCCPFLVILTILLPLRHLLTEALLPFHTWASLSWCITF